MPGTSARELLRVGAATLLAAGIASPRVDAELLLAFQLRVRRSSLVLIDAVSEADRRAFDELIRLRAQAVPVQHLTGAAPFRYLELAVGPGVFIPRPETELIIELAGPQLISAATVVDLCSGSGAIALAVAQEYHPSRVIAVERSKAALRYLHRNAAARVAAGDHPIEVIAGDIADQQLLDGLAGRVDVVLSNPPYVPDRLRADLAPEIAHDPDEAVYAGLDGLALMDTLIGVSGRLLRPGGLMVIEHDDTHSISVPAAVRAAASFGEPVDHDDLAGRPRFTSALRR